MLLSGRTALGLLFLGIGALLLRETYAVDVGAFAVPGEMGTMTYPRILLFGWPVDPVSAQPRKAVQRPRSAGQPAGRFQGRRVHRRLYHPVRYGGASPRDVPLPAPFLLSDALPGHPAHDPLRPARRGADLAGVREDSGRRRPAALLGRPVLTLGRTVCFPISCTAS